MPGIEILSAWLLNSEVKEKSTVNSLRAKNKAASDRGLSAFRRLRSRGMILLVLDW